MGYFRRATFHDQGEAYFLNGFFQMLFILDQDFFGDGYVIGGQDLLGIIFRERFFAPCAKPCLSSSLLYRFSCFLLP